MLKPQDVGDMVITELERLASEKHWGTLRFEVTLKNGDAQQLAVVTERTYREPQPPKRET